MVLSKIEEYEKLSDKAYIESIQQKYVKHLKDRVNPGKPIIKKAWVVRFIDENKYPGAWIELVMDDNGEVLRVDRSR
jgi:hypothetical protein